LLLEQSQQKTEEMRAQEEEIRQNMEELMTTQEEMKRFQTENSKTMNAIYKTLAIMEYDPNGKILKVNNKLCDILGYSEEELIGKNHKLLLVNEYKESGEYNTFFDNMRNNKSFEGELEKVCKNNTKVILKGSAEPFFNNSGDLVRIIEFFIDITRIKELEIKTSEQLHKMKFQEEELLKNYKKLDQLKDEIAKNAEEQKKKDAETMQQWKSEMQEVQKLMTGQQITISDLSRKLKQKEDELKKT